jgi:serine/threonine-protein kinase
MGTALYVSPEQATGQPLTGSSDVYSLGVVAYECLAGEPPFMAEQALAIAIMHKHDPVPPLPGDVPRPIADLVYAMLAKNAEDRPKSARHVAERAEVVREARNRNGNVYSATATSDLPVAPGTAAATSMDLYPRIPQYQDAPERLPAPRNPGNRAFLLAGSGAAAIGVVAIVAVLMSSNHSQANVGSNTTLPTQTSSPAATTKAGARTGTAQATSNVGGNPANVVVGATGTTSVTSTSLKSVAPTKSVAPKKSVAPTTQPPTTHPPTTHPPTTHPPTTQPPTTHPPTTQPPTTQPPTTQPPTTHPPTTSAPTSAKAKTSA